jgi:hypothetical protein
LVNDILGLSKIEAGKLEVDRNVCTPVQIINESTARPCLPRLRPGQ